MTDLSHTPRYLHFWKRKLVNSNKSIISEILDDLSKRREKINQALTGKARGGEMNLSFGLTGVSQNSTCQV